MLGHHSQQYLFIEFQYEFKNTRRLPDINLMVAREFLFAHLDSNKNK